MQEEVTQKTIALVIKSAKLDASILKAAMRMYLNHHRKQAQKKHGKVSVKELVRPRLKLRTATLNLLNGQPVNTMLILP